MCKGKEMDVMVMDVEGTDGRERGEDQASTTTYDCGITIDCAPRTLRESPLCSRWPLQRCCL